MPRSPRITFENAFYHIYNRGIAKEPIFKESKDYDKFLKRLEYLKTHLHFDHAIYSYVLMPNHFHLLIQSKKTPITRIMSSLTTSYAVYFNKKYSRVGPVFQNRFQSKLCERDNYFLSASFYIHLNPVKARLVAKLEDYPWSSYQEIFGVSNYSIIDYEEVVKLIGKTDKEKQDYLAVLQERQQEFDSIEKEYSFTCSSEIKGTPKFYTLSQKKYLRRKK